MEEDYEKNYRLMEINLPEWCRCRTERERQVRASRKMRTMMQLCICFSDSQTPPQKKKKFDGKNPRCTRKLGTKVRSMNLSKKQTVAKSTRPCGSQNSWERKQKGGN